MHYKILTFLIALKMVSFANAIQYTCPKVTAGNYVSIIDSVNQWHLYATDINTNQTIMLFSVKNNLIWQGRSIEPLSNKDGSFSNLISCATNVGNYFVNVMLTVPETTCEFSSNHNFTCF